MNDSHLTIYLAGNIQKGHEKESEIFWTLADQKMLAQGISPYKLTFLNPASRSDDLSDQKSVFGRDMTQVYFADAVFVDARERRGLGVGAEMMWAKMNRIPVLTLAPECSHYKKEAIQLLGVRVKNWVHPFIESLSDMIVNSLDEGILFLKRLIEGNVEIKGPESISEAMSYYQSGQLPHDIPMKKIIEENPKLQTKMESFKLYPLAFQTL